MPVFLDVESRLDRRAVEATAREISQIFSRLGTNISGDLGRALGKGVSAFDTTAARAELTRLETAWTRAADVEVDAARRMEVAAARAAEATAKYGGDSAKAMGAQATAARAQRDFTDAMVANEAAHQSHSRSMQDSAAAATMAGRAWNFAGAASLAVFTGSVLEATKAAGNFQQTQQRLVSSAGETSQNLKAVSDGILQLAGQVGYSAQELSTGMYTVEKAGYRGADGVNVLRSAAQLAKAENADLGEVLNGLTTSMHDFGYGQDRAAEVASKLNTAVGLAKTNLQEFSGALHSVEPIAAAAGLKLEDVYGSLAQITQSGTSAQQGAENMGHAITSLMKPTQQMRDEMGQLGLNAVDVQEHLGDRGFAGTVQYLSDTIRAHMNPAQQVVIDTMFKSQQASQAAQEEFDKLPPAAQRVAQSIRDGSLSFAEYRKSRGGLSVEDANMVQQWANLNNKVEGFSGALKSGQGDIQTYEQALALMTGGQENLRTVLQLVGDNAQSTNERIKAVKDTTAEADGTVKGFNETQQTLNAKMADAKAAFGAAAIEIGSAFVPFMTSAANVAKDVGDTMAKHPGIMHAVIDALGAVGAAWATVKAINIVSTILTPITTGLFGMAAAEDAAAASAGGLRGALAGIAGAAGPVVAAVAGAEELRSSSEHSSNPWFHNIGQALTHNPLSAYGLFNTVMGRAGGGPLHAPGPKGVDSRVFLGADGEHVLTHHEVQKMGGHSGVYAFRRNLMSGNLGIMSRKDGGEIGSDDVAHQIISQGQAMGAPPNVIKSALEAASVESGMRNLNYGDRDSLGIFQQRPSQGWGTPGQIMNPNYSIAKYYNTAMGVGGAAGMDPGALAQAVEGSAFPGRYDQHSGEANAYMAKFGTAPAGNQGDPYYVAMAASPPGSTPGRGPSGQAGYYTSNPERVASQQERLRHIDAEIADAEKRRDELKGNAKQYERDRIDEEIRHLRVERDEAAGKLEEAQQGTFHTSRGGSGGSGGDSNLPVPLAQGFGLSKGISGFAEWTISYLEDMVLGPLETGISAAMQRAGFPAPGSHGSGALGIMGDLMDTGAGGGMTSGPGEPGFGAPGGDIKSVGSADASGGGGSVGSGAAAGGGGGFGQWWGGKWQPTTPAAAPAAAPPEQPLYGPGGKYRSPSDVPYNERPPSWASSYWGTGRLDAPQGTPPPLGGLPVAPAPRVGANANPADPSYIPPAPWMTQPPPPPERKITANTGTLHFATGGPIGNDNIPAWVGSGEWVEPKSAVDRYGAPFMDALRQGQVDPSSVKYFDPGGPTDPTQPQPGGQSAMQQPKMPGAGPGQGAPKPGGGPGAPGQAGSPNSVHAGGLGASTPGSQQGLANVATPGATSQAPGASLPASPGIGFSGGVLGMAEGAASSAAGLAAGAGSMGAGGAAASDAMQLLFSELNRTAAFGAQAGAIMLQGLTEAFKVGDSSTGTDIPERLIKGISGARPAQPNTAGQTQQPLAGGQSNQGFANVPQGQGQGGINIHGPVNVNANNPQQFTDAMQSESQMASHAYTNNLPLGGSVR